MAENAYYRDNLEELLKFFNGKRLLSIADIILYTGLDRRTIKKRFAVGSEGISIATFARKLSKL